MTAPTLTLSLVQAATHWHDPEANRSMFSGLLTGLAEDVRVVLLPEMFSTGFTMHSAQVAETMDGETVEWMRQESAGLDKVLCGSVVIEEAGAYYNRFLAAYPDGDVLTYDKRHRFRMAGEHQHYSAGGEKIVFEVDGWRICPMVCYDLRFPVWFRNRDEYDVLVCVANWPAARRDAWTTLLRARAIENQAYVAAVNIVGTDGNGVMYSGGSACYTGDGGVLGEAFDTAQTLTCTLSASGLHDLRQAFPVSRDADDFELKTEHT